MYFCPDPAAWRKGAEAVVRNVLQPLISRRYVRARFWPRRWSFFVGAPHDPQTTQMPPPAAAASVAVHEQVAGWLWQAEMRRVLWFGAPLPALRPTEAAWMYGDIALPRLLSPLTPADAHPIAAEFQRSLFARPARPLRTSERVDDLLSEEPWFGPVPFLTFHRLLATPDEQAAASARPATSARATPPDRKPDSRSDWIAADCWGALDWEATDAQPLGPLLDAPSRQKNNRLPPKAPLPRPPHSLHPDPLASILARASTPRRSQEASGLGKLSLGKLPTPPLRASNANGLPKGRPMPPRRANRSRRIGQR